MSTELQQRLAGLFDTLLMFCTDDETAAALRDLREQTMAAINAPIRSRVDVDAIAAAVLVIDGGALSIRTSPHDVVGMLAMTTIPSGDRAAWLAYRQSALARALARQLDAADKNAGAP